MKKRSAVRVRSSVKRAIPIGQLISYFGGTGSRLGVSRLARHEGLERLSLCIHFSTAPQSLSLSLSLFLSFFRVIYERMWEQIVTSASKRCRARLESSAVPRCAAVPFLQSRKTLYTRIRVAPVASSKAPSPLLWTESAGTLLKTAYTPARSHDAFITAIRRC